MSVAEIQQPLEFRKGDATSRAPSQAPPATRDPDPTPPPRKSPLAPAISGPPLLSTGASFEGSTSKSFLRERRGRNGGFRDGRRHGCGPEVLRWEAPRARRPGTGGGASARRSSSRFPLPSVKWDWQCLWRRGGELQRPPKRPQSRDGFGHYGTLARVALLGSQRRDGIGKDAGRPRRLPWP